MPRQVEALKLVRRGGKLDQSGSMEGVKDDQIRYIF